MANLTKFEKRVLEHAMALAVKSFTPTALGMAMGYEQTAASSRVAPALRTLTEAGALKKTPLSGNRVTYSVVPECPLVAPLLPSA